MVNKYGNIDPQAIQRAQLAELPRVEAGSQQERVYNEMFKAIEMLGRRLEKSESERERLSRRLSLIESAATVDEKTGRLFLPAVLSEAQVAQVSTRTPRWAMTTSGLSLCIAVFSLWLAFSNNSGPSLTPQQLAVLDAISNNRMASLDVKNWQPIDAASNANTPANTNTNINDELGATAPTTPLIAPEATASEAPAEMASAADNLMPADTATENAAIEPATGDAAQAVDHTAALSAQAKTTADTADTLAQAVAAEEKVADKTADKVTLDKKKAPVASAAPAMTAARPRVAPPAVTAEDVSEAVTAAEEMPVETAAPEVAQAAPAPATAPTARSKQQAAKPREVAGEAAVYSRIPADTNLPADLAQLEQRAMEDVPEAQHDLATLYAAGKVVGQDYKRAVYWFSRAADGGIANAHYNLGVMFQQGLGVRKDVKKAVRWYKSAAELGHPEAMYNLGISYIEGIGTARDIEKGASYFRRAANAGVAQAAYNLGVLYESNFLGAADAGQAIDWYKKSATLGHAEGKDAVARLQQAQAQSLAKREPAAGGR